jgi:HEAT repeat protein
MSRTSIILLGSVLILTVTWQLQLKYAQSGSEASLAASTSSGSCQSQSRRGYIHKLSYDTPEGPQAASKLIDEANESRECRDGVINELMRALKEADLQNDQSAFLLWARGSGILGELKAVESLDLLIDHLNLNDGLFSASMIHQPVVPAVEKMGWVAVPKLGFALKHHPNREIRLAAALCLADIDGSEVQAALKEALNTETDQCVRHFITLLLLDPTEAVKSNPHLYANEGEILRQRLLAFTCGN